MMDGNYVKNRKKISPFKNHPTISTLHSYMDFRKMFACRSQLDYVVVDVLVARLSQQLAVLKEGG